jgi:RNA polymerase sigma-70 factor (ECF subfamily)
MAEQGLLRELVRNAKCGDAAAFERIIALHEHMVLRVAQRLLANNEDAKDTAQEVFLRLHRKLGRLEEDRDLAPWLYRVTVNVCRDVVRRSRKSAPMNEAESVASDEEGPEAAAITAQQKRLVLAALARLTHREREAVVLRDLEGRTTSEIAGILGSSEGTVRSQLSTGRVKIRNYIADRTRRQI